MWTAARAALSTVIAIGAWTLTSAAAAQTMSQVASGQSSCTTAGGEGLSTQLVDVQRCLHPGQFVSFANANITPTSARVHLVAQASARDALQVAAASVPLQINSGFRPLSDQYLLWASGNCAVVAAPGSSNHQSGRAVDVDNTVEARTALTDAGCVWLGASDAVHYDCPGMDLRADAVRAFQRLWNINHPEMPLAEDGDWGPMTLAAMQASPAAGFALGGLTTCGPCAAGADPNACGTCGPVPVEVCDGNDNDCDGTTDEGCGTSDPDAGVSADGGTEPDAGVVDGGTLDAETDMDLGAADAFMTVPDGGVGLDLGAGQPHSGCSVAVGRARPGTGDGTEGTPPFGGHALLALLGWALRARMLRRGARPTTMGA
ncbi:MAG: M15 family metallopeptidase [Polyangiales bacterium]